MKRHKEIQQLAHELFEKSGRVHGRELDHWLEAERTISAREADMHATVSKTASPGKQIVQRSDLTKPRAKKTGRSKKST